MNASGSEAARVAGGDPGGSWRPGYPAERTSMAWIRTSLSIFIASGAMIRLSILDSADWAWGLGVFGSAGCLLCIWESWRRIRRGISDVRSGSSTGTPTTMVLAAVVSVACVGIGALGLAVLALVG